MVYFLVLLFLNQLYKSFQLKDFVKIPLAPQEIQERDFRFVSPGFSKTYFRWCLCLFHRFFLGFYCFSVQNEMKTTETEMTSQGANQSRTIAIRAKP